MTSHKSNDINKTSAEEIKRISLSRTKKNILEIALCNSFEYFVTLTVKLNNVRYDLELAQFELKKLLKAYKRKYKNFKFIIITEKHKDGAYHFHRFNERT